MRISRWKYIQQHCWVGTLIIFSVILGSLLPQLAIILPLHDSLQDDAVHVDILADIEALVEIPRLMKQSSGGSVRDSIEGPPEIRSTPNLAIGQQAGTGGGSYSVYDSFNWTGSEPIDTQNGLTLGTFGFVPTEREDSITITDPNGYTNQYTYFNISDIQAKEDWRLEVDYNTSIDTIWTSQFGGSGGDQWYTIGISFEIKEDSVNLSGVQTFTTDQGFSPAGEIWIEGKNTSSGTPNGTVLSEVKPLTTSNGWNQYAFTPIVLSKGEYFVVMNDSDGADDWYWDWFTMYDSVALGDGIDSNKVFNRFSYGGTWFEQTSGGAGFDAPLQIQVLPVEHNGTNWVAKKYNLVTNIQLWYNTTAGGGSEVLLDDSSWFEANATPTHTFKSNASVVFTLNFVANYTYTLNPMSVTPTYLVANNSVVNWNLTFTTAALNTTYSIRNHSIRIADFEPDWNGTTIYWNNSAIPQYSDLPTNTSVSPDGDYSNRYQHRVHTSMYVNASDLSENTTWHVWFEAPNHLLNFTVGQGSTPLAFPYEANVTDVLNLTFYTSDMGNLTYWIDYPNGSTRTRVNINTTDTVFWEEWDINKTVDQTININGTYQLQAFWNNSDLTQIGTFTRTLDVFVNTSLTLQADAEVIIGQKFNVTANYKSIHNDSDVQGVLIWANASFPSGAKPNETMNQLGDNSYNASFDTAAESVGETGNVTITTMFPWFVNWTIIIDIKFVSDSTLSVNTTDLSLEWRQNITLEIIYNQSGGGWVENATIAVDGDSSSAYNISDVYYFPFNSTKYGGVGPYLDLNVTANHSDYLTKTWYFNLTITLGITNISSLYGGQPFYNETENIVVRFANTSVDEVSVNLQYYHLLTDDNLSTGAPTVESLLPYTNTSLPDTSWEVTFNPNRTGVFVINITFNLGNYTDTLFTFNITVQSAQTKVQFVNNVNNSKVEFTESFDFALFYNNTDWNENITFNDNNNIGITGTSKVQFLNRTGDYYWFRFNSSQLVLGENGSQIVFSAAYFESSSITVVFTVIEMPTSTISLSNIHLTNNGSVLIEEPLEITIDSYQTFRRVNITSLDEIFLWLNGTAVPEIELLNLQISHAPFSFSVSTEGWQYGFYNLTFQIQTTGYQSQLISANITLLGRSTWIELEILPGKTISQGENITFVVTLGYNTTTGSGFGSSVQLVPLEGVEVFFYVELMYVNDTSRLFQQTILTDDNGQATYSIDGQFTTDSIGFANVTVSTSSSLSGLPANLVEKNLGDYKFVVPPLDLWELLTPYILPLAGLVVVLALAVGGGYRFNKSRKVRKKRAFQVDQTVEKGFEDIKSIRLVIARHQSGLQFYSEKTISELQADTDALSGMSAAISSFMEEVSESMRSRPEDIATAQIETMSREGLHMLIWHGRLSSVIIISELKLPEYYKDRMDGLGHELEEKFEPDLMDFYSTDQIPYNVVKKIVRKYIPLHYFSAFVLNEGVLTLEDLKLSKKEKDMLKLIKKVMFEREGVQYLFSEQIISYLARKYKRSQAIKFLDQAIEWNLLVECDQEDILRLAR